jgi:hypothetical protein
LHRHHTTVLNLLRSKARGQNGSAIRPRNVVAVVAAVRG